MRRRLGLITLGCFAVHAVGCYSRGVASDVLWACQIAVAVLGVGLIGRSPQWTGAACLGILLGTPLWLIDVLCGAELIPTSLGTHVGGFVVAVLTVRSTGLPRGSWWRTWLGGAALQQLTRVVTEPSRNINAAFEVYDRFQTVWNSYPAYLAALGTTVALCLWCGECSLRRVCRSTAASFWSDGASS